MKALMIILIVIAVLVVLLLIPLNVYIDYDGKAVKLWLRYLFVKIPITPKTEKKKKAKNSQNPKRPKKVKKPKADTTENNIPKENAEKQTESTATQGNPKQDPPTPQKKESTAVKLFKAHGLSGVIEILEEALSIVKNFLNCVLKHIIVKKLTIHIDTGGEDAYHTAMNFGYVCSGVYPLLGMLSALITFKKVPDICIQVDYDRKSSKICLFWHISTRPLFLLTATVVYGIKAVKLYLNITNTDKNSKDGV